MNKADPSGVAVVTGGARGIGAAVAAGFVRSGTPVALLDRDDAVLTAGQKLAAAGTGVLPLVVDVADADQVENAVARIEAELGPVTKLANVAGLLRYGSVFDLGDEDFARSIAVNTTGVWNTCRAVGHRMRNRGAGSIVTVASNAATTPRVGMAAYSASKAAAVALTRGFGLELAPAVRCNVVCPGSTDTEMLRSMWADPGDDSGLDAVVAGNPQDYRLGIPLRRVATAEDIASVVLYLASDDARHVTMQSLTVDGGATLGA